jgi:hypothetical protein
MRHAMIRQLSLDTTKLPSICLDASARLRAASALRDVSDSTPNLSSQIFQIAALDLDQLALELLHICLVVKGGGKLTKSWGQPVGATWVQPNRTSQTYHPYLSVDRCSLLLQLLYHQPNHICAQMVMCQKRMQRFVDWPEQA